MAGAACVAVDEGLRGEDEGGEGVVPSDVDAVGEGGGGCEGPARGAVAGDVLVPGEAEEVDSADVAPVELPGEVGDLVGRGKELFSRGVVGGEAGIAESNN